MALAARTSGTPFDPRSLDLPSIGALVVLEESARSYNEARIRPLTYVSVDRAYQAESVGSNFL